MPIYMDRHDVSESVTAENVAQLHQQDLKVQDKFNCRGLTYWFDEKRKTAFCLIEAPNEQAIREMHNHAHGEVPNMIIEVDAKIVETFLGRIEDPTSAKNTDLNIINDPAFRTIMVVWLKKVSLKRDSLKESEALLKKLMESVHEQIQHFEGSLVNLNGDGFLVSFKSVTNALMCAREFKSKFEALTKASAHSRIKLKIGLAAGLPITRETTFFEDTLKLADRLCYVNGPNIVMSSEVKDLYKSENLNNFFEREEIRVLTLSDEIFLNQLFDFIEKKWRNAELSVSDFNKNFGMSKSRFYHKMILLTGESPNKFLKEYRLNRALELIFQRTENISGIAFDTGFGSPSYFSKCFRKRYGLQPSEYLHTKM